MPMDLTYHDIQSWISEHANDDAVLSQEPVRQEEHTWASSDKPGVYSTKARSLLSRGSFETESAALIGTYGVPTPDRLDWLCASASASQNRVGFLGDLDGPDLLTFAAIQSRCLSEVSYLGISDDLLERLSIPISSLSEYIMSSSNDDVAAFEFLNQSSFSATSFVGKHCASILESKRKIEVEALLWKATLDDVLALVQ